MNGEKGPEKKLCCSRGVRAHGALGPVVRTVSKGHDRTKKRGKFSSKLRHLANTLD